MIRQNAIVVRPNGGCGHDASRGGRAVYLTAVPRARSAGYFAAFFWIFDRIA
jgi:hypothetical protein